MAELDCKTNYELHKRALEKAKMEKNDFLVVLLTAMNPKALSQSDIDTLEDILEQ